jgi:hypothetical protein
MDYLVCMSADVTYEELVESYNFLFLKYPIPSNT